MTVNVIVNEGELGVLKNIRRKSEQADRMFTELCRHMHDSMVLVKEDVFPMKEGVPTWV